MFRYISPRELYVTPAMFGGTAQGRIARLERALAFSESARRQLSASTAGMMKQAAAAGAAVAADRRRR